MANIVPPRPNITYLPHQIDGVRWMLAREDPAAVVCRGGILADDMGLGKTFQTIGLLKNAPAVLRTLIVCPPALIAGWTAELRACGYSVAVLVGSSWNIPYTTNVVYLTSYSKVCLYRRELALAEPAFARVVLDEGHVIRNGLSTSRWMSCMAIAKRATCRWILSATPVQNGPTDWRNLCWWLRVRCPAPMIPELAPTLMLRRTMEELRGVAGMESLPPLPRFIRHPLSISPETPEGRLFRILCDQAADAPDASPLIKLELWMRIQQFLVHPQIYIDAMRSRRPTLTDWPEDGGATKWNACMNELRRAVDLNIGTIVFCQFRAEIDRVCIAATDMGASVFAIRGGMPSDAVGEAVRAAAATVALGNPVVVVVQIVAGGAGLNLQFCRRILFLSQHWNPAVVHQAVGRAVRIGQLSSVEIHFFAIDDDVCDNLDRHMAAVHLAKIAGAREISPTLYQGFYTFSSPSL